MKISCLVFLILFCFCLPKSVSAQDDFLCEKSISNGEVKRVYEMFGKTSRSQRNNLKEEVEYIVGKVVEYDKANYMESFSLYFQSFSRLSFYEFVNNTNGQPQEGKIYSFFKNEKFHSISFSYNGRNKLKEVLFNSYVFKNSIFL